MTIKTKADIEKAISDETFFDELMHDVEIVVQPSEHPDIETTVPIVNNSPRFSIKIKFPDWFQFLTPDTQTTCIKLIRENAQGAYDSHNDALPA